MLARSPDDAEIFIMEGGAWSGEQLLLFRSQLDSRVGSIHPRGVGGGERGEALVMQDACLLPAPPWSPGAGLCTPPCRVLQSLDRS